MVACGMSHNIGPDDFWLPFNKTLLGEGGQSDTVAVQPYYKGDVTVNGKLYGDGGSKMEGPTNSSTFCHQSGEGA